MYACEEMFMTHTDEGLPTKIFALVVPQDIGEYS